MKKFVKIQSSINITVDAGLTCINMTNADARVAERLKVQPTWVGTRINIEVGAHYYPAIIKTWDSVKSLAKRSILTIGEECDECPEQEKVEAMCKKLDNVFKDTKDREELTKEVEEKVAKSKEAKVKNIAM